VRDYSKRFAFATLTLIGVAVAAGCQRNDGRNAVGGTVTLDGQPLAGAVVHFQPLPGQAGSSSGATTDANGRFTIAGNKGLLPGKYATSVQAWKGTGKMSVDSLTGKQFEITVPISFKDDGKLESTITPEGPNQFEFRLIRAK
jgi:hypothetical protein